MANMVNELTGQTLRKFNHQTFKKGLIQTLFFQTFKKFDQQTFRKSFTKNAAQLRGKKPLLKKQKEEKNAAQMEFEDGLKKVHGWSVENWEDIDKNAEF